MKQENNTSKKKWVTPRKLGLAGKNTKVGNTSWLPEGATTRNSTPRYGRTTYHTTRSSTTSNSTITGYSFSTSTGQS